MRVSASTGQALRIEILDDRPWRPRLLRWSHCADCTVLMFT